MMSFRNPLHRKSPVKSPQHPQPPYVPTSTELSAVIDQFLQSVCEVKYYMRRQMLNSNESFRIGIDIYINTLTCVPCPAAERPSESVLTRRYGGSTAVHCHDPPIVVRPGEATLAQVSQARRHDRIHRQSLLSRRDGPALRAQPRLTAQRSGAAFVRELPTRHSLRSVGHDDHGRRGQSHGTRRWDDRCGNGGTADGSDRATGRSAAARGDHDSILGAQPGSIPDGGDGDTDGSGRCRCNICG
jgi:hypothetical protein